MKLKRFTVACMARYRQSDLSQRTVDRTSLTEYCAAMLALVSEAVVLKIGPNTRAVSQGTGLVGSRSSVR